MPILGPADPLPHRPHRVLVAGTSGSGKTTTAARIAAVLDAPHVEIDALFHGADWVPRPTFEADVDRFSAERSWVTEWQYGSVRDLLAERADLLVWLNLPRSVVMRQIAGRTIVRRLRRQELWNGNVEPPLRTVFTDPEHVVRWAWKTHHPNAARVAGLASRKPDLPVIRMRRWHEVEQWINGPLQATVAAHSEER